MTLGYFFYFKKDRQNIDDKRLLIKPISSITAYKFNKPSLMSKPKQRLKQEIHVYNGQL